MANSKSETIAKEIKICLQNYFAKKGWEMENPNSWRYAYDIILRNKKGNFLGIQVVTSKSNSLALSPNSRKKIGIAILDKGIYTGVNSNEFAIAFPESYFLDNSLVSVYQVLKENEIAVYFVSPNGTVKKK